MATVQIEHFTSQGVATVDFYKNHDHKNHSDMAKILCEIRFDCLEEGENYPLELFEYLSRIMHQTDYVKVATIKKTGFCKNISIINDLHFKICCDTNTIKSIFDDGMSEPVVTTYDLKEFIIKFY